MLALVLTLAAQAATPLAGVEWTPLSRADLVWVDGERTSGLLVGEYDGFVRPSLEAFGGAWLSERVGLVATLGVARLNSTTWVGETWTQRHWGVVRPGLDLRLSLTSREVGRPALWLDVGAHGDIPSARNTSSAYTPEEQATADEDAWIERARLGGFGGHLGAGVDYRIAEGLLVGARYALGYHRGVLQTSETSVVSSWLASTASLSLGFEWGER